MGPKVTHRYLSILDHLPYLIYVAYKNIFKLLYSNENTHWEEIVHSKTTRIFQMPVLISTLVVKTIAYSFLTGPLTELTGPNPSKPGHQINLFPAQFQWLPSVCKTDFLLPVQIEKVAGSMVTMQCHVFTFCYCLFAEAKCLLL